jgi:hypothetical protein
MRKQEEDLRHTLAQKDEVISEQKLLIEKYKEDIQRKNDELVTEQEKHKAAVKRIQEERDAIESKFRAQLKRQRCGASKSLLSQAEQGQKAHVVKHNLLPNGPK